MFKKQSLIDLKDTDKEGFPLVLTEFIQTDSLQLQSFRLVFFVCPTVLQFVIVYPSVLSYALSLYTKMKTMNFVSKKETLHICGNHTNSITGGARQLVWQSTWLYLRGQPPGFESQSGLTLFLPPYWIWCCNQSQELTGYMYNSCYR